MDIRLLVGNAEHYESFRAPLLAGAARKSPSTLVSVLRLCVSGSTKKAYQYGSRMSGYIEVIGSTARICCCFTRWEVRSVGRFLCTPDPHNDWSCIGPAIALGVVIMRSRSHRQ